MTTKSIVVKDLHKTYGDFVALNGISFDVEPGEIVGFLGPNGAGKTTTMKILTCFMAASAGDAEVAGHDVYSDSKAARRKIGYLPENVPLYDDMLVFDYLKFIAEVRGVDSDKRESQIKKVVELTGLTQMLGRDIGQLSKGYRQRVGLAQAIIHEPDVVILDEPTSGLDPNQILEIRDLIKEIGREKTVIFSTHILQEVAAVCDRIIVINKGSIVADGPLDELASSVSKDAVDIMTDASRSALSKLPAVEDVTEVDGPNGTIFRATGNIEKIKAQVIEALGEQVDEISTHRPSLEDIFRALTGGDPTSAHVTKRATTSEEEE